MKRKKKNKRNSSKFKGLDLQVNLKIRRDELEVDYLNKLSEKEKKWLSKFNEEYVNASLDREKPWRNLHKTKKLIKDCTDRNNYRNNDVLAKAKANNWLKTEEKIPEYLEQQRSTNSNEVEDALIEMIDANEELPE